MTKKYLTVDDDNIVKNEYVNIIAVPDSVSPINFRYGQIKPLDDQAVQCLKDNFVTKYLLLSDEFQLEPDSRLEFSGTKLPTHLYLGFNSFLSITDHAQATNVRINEYCHVEMNKNTILKDSVIDDDSEIHLTDNAQIISSKIKHSALFMSENVKITNSQVKHSTGYLENKAHLDTMNIRNSDIISDDL